MKSKLIDAAPEQTFALVFEPGEEVISGLLRLRTSGSSQARI
jgi:hypothetical protein